MRRLNRKFLGSSLFFAAVIAAGTFGIHAFQFGRQTDFFIEQAESAMSNGDPASAAGLYRQALTMDPKRLTTLFGLAAALEELGDYPAVYSISQRAELLDGANVENQKRIARASFRLQRFADTIERVEALLGIEDDASSAQITSDSSSLVDLENPASASPDDVDLWALLADARVANRDAEGGIEAYRVAVSTGAADIDIHARYASVLSDRVERDSDAVGVLDAMVDQFLDRPEAWVARGQWYLRQSRRGRRSSVGTPQTLLQTARRNAESAMQLDERNGDAISFATAVELQDENYDAAERLSQRLIEVAPLRSDGYRYAAAALSGASAAKVSESEKMAGNRRALAILQTGVQRLPNDASLLWTLASQQLELGEAKAAKETSDRLRQLGYAPPLTRYLEARLSAVRGEVHSAVRQLEKVRSDVIETPELVRVVDLTLGEMYEAMGDTDRQISVLRRVVAVDPLWLPGRERLAMAYLRAGRIDEAVQEYRMVSDRPGTPITAPLNYARLLLLQNLQRETADRDWSRLDQVLNALDKQPKLAVDVALIRTEKAVAKDDPDAAREVLVKAAQTADEDGQIRIAATRVLLEVAENNPALAMEVADQSRESFGDSPLLRYAATTALVASNAPDLADQLAALATAPDDWTDDQKISLANQLTPILISNRQYQVASELAELSTRLRPGNVRARLQTIQIAFQRGDVESLRSSIDALEEITGRDARWYYAKALQTAMAPKRNERAIAEAGSNASTGVDQSVSQTTGAFSIENIDPESNAKTQEYLAEASVLRPDWAILPALSAMVYDKSGSTDAAIIKYNAAVDLGWRDPTTIRRLINLLTADERFGEADSVIRRLRTGNQPFTSELSRIASEVSVEMADLQRAVRLASDAANQSGTSADYLWLGQLSELTGDAAAAEQAYRNAMDAAPENATPRLTWIGFLERNSRVGEAREALANYESQIDSSDIVANLLLAEGFERIGQTNDATRVLKNVDQSRLGSMENFIRYYSVVKQTAGLQSAQNILQGWLSASTASDPKTATQKTGGDIDTASLEVPAAARPWIRRQLALDLAAAGNIQNYSRARTLVETNLIGRQTPAPGSNNNPTNNPTSRRAPAPGSNNNPANNPTSRRALAPGSNNNPTNNPISRRALAPGSNNNPANNPTSRRALAPGSNNNNSRQTFDDRRALALINAVFLGRNQPETPLKQFEQLIDDGWIASVEDQFTIGKLYAQTGQMTRGRRMMLPLLGNKELSRPVHIKSYVESLLRQGDAREAELWLDRLEQSGVRDRQTAIMVAEVILRRGQYDTLLDYLTVAPEDVANRGDARLRWFAAALSSRERFQLLARMTTRLASAGNEEIGSGASPPLIADDQTRRRVVENFEAAADAMSDRLRQRDEFPGMFYAVQLLTRGDCDAAADALATAAQSGTEQELVNFAERAIAQPACRGSLQQIENVYQQRAGETAENLTFAVIVARLRETRGDYDSAAAMYESILKRDPEHFVSKNNLATLLALQNKDTDRALDLINSVIQTDGPTLVSLDTRGVVQMAAKQYESAAADFKAAYQLYPHPVVQFHKAQLAMEFGDFQAASQAFQAAKTAGLSEGDVHPLEFKVYQQLQKLN